jgi:hypothetical protein
MVAASSSTEMFHEVLGGEHSTQEGVNSKAEIT